MESPEEDAGAAAIASRSASARERDVGGGPDGGGGMGPEPAPASSEDAFDADSVPSPSPSQELNTSTEAILDMIDEIVEGPDATRRCSRTSDELETEGDGPPAALSSLDTLIAAAPSPTPVDCDNSQSELQETVQHPPAESLPNQSGPTSESSVEKVSPEEVNNESEEFKPDMPTGDSTLGDGLNASSVQEIPSVTNTDIVDKQPEPEDAKNLRVCSPGPIPVLPAGESSDSVSSKSHSSEQVESRLSNEVQLDSVNIIETIQESDKVEQSQDSSEQNRHPESPQASSSVTSNEVAQSTSEPSQLQPEQICNLSPSIPSSSETEPVPIKLDSSENQSCERTIKCVTSSDNRDTVTVESAESTCSESSMREVGEGSRLRRRLVRPTPLAAPERRSDATVSSSADSDSHPVHTTEHTTSDNVTKDVSSSSDAVPSVYFNKKPEEIRDVSEISICKAETSVSPPKKIKLVRQKIVPSTSQRDVIPDKPVNQDSDQCQSTSLECVPSTPAHHDTSLSERVAQSADVVPALRNESGMDNPPANLPEVTDSEKKCTDCDPTQASPSSAPASIVTESQTNEENDQRKVPPIKLNLTTSTETSITKIENYIQDTASSSITECQETLDSSKQVPKLTIKLGNKPTEEQKSPIPKLTIKPIRPPLDTEDSKKETVSEQIPSVTKLNIKPIPKPAEKINDIHRKSSSSEISESESSENDESNGMSDPTSNSDQGSEVVPKVTIKVGKRGTESEGKFYTEQNVPKLLIKNVQPQENDTLEEKPIEKIPKLTIKTVVKTDGGQPLSPKLTIKTIKPPETDAPPIPKLKITAESLTASVEVKENAHVPKITIKPVVKTDSESPPKPLKKSTLACDSSEHIPVVTKLNIKPLPKPSGHETPDNSEENIPIVSKINIKPIVKPVDSSDVSEDSEGQIPVVSKLTIKPILKPSEPSEEVQDIPVVSKLNIKPVLKPVQSEDSSEVNKDKVPVVSKLNIKPIIKPMDSESSSDEIPKVTKLNIKPLKNPEAGSAAEKDCNALNAEAEGDVIPIVTKINIKPIVKPDDEDISKDSENQSSETGNSSDENADIPVVTKLNIKPVIKPNEETENTKINSNQDNIPVVTRLNIKPLVKPEESKSPASPKKDSLKITKLNIKPVLKPEEPENHEITQKNPPIVMKIHMKDVTSMETSDDKKVNNIGDKKEHLVNNIEDDVPKVSLHLKTKTDTEVEKRISAETTISLVNCKQDSLQADATKANCVPEIKEKPSGETNRTNENIKLENATKVASNQSPRRTQPTMQNCTLLKKLLETKKDGLDKRLEDSKVNSNHSLPGRIEKDNTIIYDAGLTKDPKKTNDTSALGTEAKHCDHKDDSCKELRDSLTKPLEISISDKHMNQSSGQDSPRIILKINKTDHGPKIVTEERLASPRQQNDLSDNTQDIVNDKQTPKRVVNSRKKPQIETTPMAMGKRLRSSRVVEEQSPEKTPVLKRNVGKRPTSTETSPEENKETDLTVLEAKRLKLGQLLSSKALSSAPANTKTAQPLTKTSPETVQVAKTVNHSILNNENCSKNGNSKLHNILTNLQAKQAQALARSNADATSVEHAAASVELESNASTGSSDVVEVIMPAENSHSDAPEVISINDNSESHSLLAMEDTTGDPLAVEPAPSESAPETPLPASNTTVAPAPTPTPKKRGRPRKVPAPDTPAPTTPAPLPTTALEERPQRSLRLSRERPTPTIVRKPRGRGRGRGARRVEPESPREEPIVETANKFLEKVTVEPEEDPTSSRIKLPRMTEALDKLPSTPLSSRRRSSATPFETEPKVVLDILPEEALRSPPATPVKTGRGGRGRGSRGRTPGRSPRGQRGRARGGGRGAQYMKETMGIYGRVCGPATTTVQLFEEETCMMDDNATPAKPIQYDEDSQSSVLSSTNDSSKMKKSKFADLFDSNKVWTAADVKEYMWPPPETPDVEHQVMMIQEQVAMFLGVLSFKRRYPELKRRPVAGAERQYVLDKGLATEALCDLGITAVDASEVLDIMLSDYPHKYDEYRTHQRQRQLAEASAKEAAAKETAAKEIAAKETAAKEIATTEETSVEKMERVELKPEVVKPVETKPEVPKVDLEKARLEAMAAAIASASEFNARMNATRRPAYVDLQTHTIHLRRQPAGRAPQPSVCPPGGFYPHSLLPGQYQHHYSTYTSEQLRYFPLNTVTAAPPPLPSPVPSESESDGEWGSSSGSDESSTDRPSAAKRKKLTKTKRGSQAEGSSGTSTKDEIKEEVVDLCRVCKLRLEANKKHTYERFLVCSQCNAKLHPGCVDLSADTVRKAREYPWQCAECKTCCACSAPSDAGSMLFCDLCDRGYHTYCLQLDKVPSGRWHCAECAICKSCGAREPTGPPNGGTPGGPNTPSTPGGLEEATWHHHTKRGPGGHKVYSHSLCTPCARAFRIGRYCPLCERSFIGPKGTMQLVICKLCDRQHHQECVKQTVSTLNVLDYTCSECRRGGITSRSAAARLAPRTIATLFMAKRRFNKYAHRQYMNSRQRVKPSEPVEDTSMDTDLGEEASCEPPEPVLAPLETSDGSECGGDTAEARDPLEGVGATGPVVTITPDDTESCAESTDPPEITPSDPPDGSTDPPDGSTYPPDGSTDPPDEAAAAVAALRMDFGD